MRSMQCFAIEMYPVTNNVSPELMKEVFNVRGEIGHDLRHQNIFKRPLICLVQTGTERVDFF